MLGLQKILPVPQSLRFVLLVVAICYSSREVLRGRPSRPLLSVVLGLAVFAIWVGPDFLFPGWHHSVLFSNAIMGTPTGTPQTDLVFLVPRIAISVLVVPVLEELFWRGWMMRWLIDAEHFERVPLGQYAPQAFWIVAVLFALEHGSFWDVGLVTGLVYNWWMVRTRNLWDCILAHAVTNAALAAYVVFAGQWQYWL